MGEVFEPLDPADVEAVAEGEIGPDDARPVDEPDVDAGLDSERPVVLDVRRDDGTEAISGDVPDIDESVDPRDQ